jgi:hypothetical protein
VGKNAGQRCWKTEAIGQHVFFAGLAEIFPKIFIAVQNLAENSFRTGKIDVAFFDGRTCGKPSSLGDVLLQSGVVRREILLHQAIAICPGPIENVVGVSIDVVKVNPHRFEQVFADGLRELPSPLRIQMRVWNNIQRRNLRYVGSLHGLPANCNGQHQGRKCEHICCQSMGISFHKSG